LALALAALPSVAAEAETLEIVALGDSLTAGYGLPQGEGFVPQLQNWLTERGHDVTVVNAGVSGDTTAGGLSRVDWALSDDTDAMIVTLGGNDLLRGIDPANARGNIDGILQAGQARDLEILLVGMKAPGNYGPEYQQDFDAIYPDLAEQYGTLYEEAFFGALTAEGDGPAAARAFMQPDGIHPNAEGVARIVAALGPRVEELIAEAQD